MTPIKNASRTFLFSQVLLFLNFGRTLRVRSMKAYHAPPTRRTINGSLLRFGCIFLRPYHRRRRQSGHVGKAVEGVKARRKTWFRPALRFWWKQDVRRLPDRGLG